MMWFCDFGHEISFLVKFEVHQSLWHSDSDSLGWNVIRRSSRFHCLNEVIFIFLRFSILSNILCISVWLLRFLRICCEMGKFWYWENDRKISMIAQVSIFLPIPMNSWIKTRWNCS
jgi:hypothetical protein